jgi:hypothetical protein
VQLGLVLDHNLRQTTAMGHRLQDCGASEVRLFPLALIRVVISNPQPVYPWRKSPLKPRLSATRNVETTQRSIGLPFFPARSQTERYSPRER